MIILVPKKFRSDRYPRVTFDELLAQSDIISVHCPLNDASYHLFGGEEFRKMKSTAYLVNVSRGAVVDTAALSRAIDEHVIGGAALDVFEQEPLPMSHPLMSVKDHDRLVMSPHIGWNSVEAKRKLLDEICINIKNFQEGGMRNRVEGSLL